VFFAHNMQGEVEDWLVSRLIGEIPKPPPLELPLPFSLQDYVVRRAAPHSPNAAAALLPLPPPGICPGTLTLSAAVVGCL
jgi:hypothetical protein